jgi:hypothetical protein
MMEDFSWTFATRSMSLTDASNTGPRQQAPRYTRPKQEARRAEEADTKSDATAGSLGEPSCARRRCRDRDEELQLKKIMGGCKNWTLRS